MCGQHNQLGSRSISRGLPEIRLQENDLITKDAILHYFYGVSNDPVDREKYDLNLKREFPRIRAGMDFRPVQRKETQRPNDPREVQHVPLRGYKKMIDLLLRVTTVSVRTVAISVAMTKSPRQ
jgi:predicted helicase